MRGVTRVSKLRRVALFLLLSAAVGSQIALEGRFARQAWLPSVQWVRSPELLRRLTLGYNAIWADVYWIRAIQYFGSTRLSTHEDKNYDLLYPLLNITTALDPYFSIAYRLGAILLSEGYPNGAGNSDQAIALLEKGIREAPERWEYYHDAGFVNYWWRRDPETAAQWFLKAADLPGAPAWLRPVAASVLAEGGEREPARALWLEMLATADHDWLRQAARRGLMQIDAEAHIELLNPVINRFYDERGRFPATWNELVISRRLRQPPVDPAGYVYALDPVSGTIDVAPRSPLYPLRRGAGGN
jgi:hypothetical protein